MSFGVILHHVLLFHQYFVRITHCILQIKFLVLTQWEKKQTLQNKAPNWDWFTGQSQNEPKGTDTSSYLSLEGPTDSNSLIYAREEVEVGPRVRDCD